MRKRAPKPESSLENALEPPVAQLGLTRTFNLRFVAGSPIATAPEAIKKRKTASKDRFS